jgi:hypothetical protein
VNFTLKGIGANDRHLQIQIDMVTSPGDNYNRVQSLSEKCVQFQFVH